MRKYNKKKPESEKLKGSLRNLLKKPATRAILMKNNTELQQLLEEKPSPQTKTSKKIKNISASVVRPVDIVCPAISPLPTMNLFQFSMGPLTPSTTPSILSSKFNSNYFNFPDEFSFVENIHCKNEVEGNIDIFKSEQSTPRYFLPHFSPKTSFQHYYTPRNSISK